MKELIDFDNRFNEYMDQWADKLLKEGKKPKEIEELIPDVYAKWAKEAGSYFDGMDARELTQMLGAYMDEEISVPDILTERIVSCPACEDALSAMLKEERSDSDKILLMNLLSDMGSEKPIAEYVRLIRLAQEESEVVDAAAEALKYGGKAAQKAVLEALAEEHDPVIMEKMLYALVYSEPRVGNLSAKLNELMYTADEKAVVAGLMAYYGDAACLPALKPAENDPDIDYLEYTEICDAIESLGGETDRKREFNGDEYYEFVHSGGTEN